MLRCACLASVSRRGLHHSLCTCPRPSLLPLPPPLLAPSLVLPWPRQVVADSLALARIAAVLRRRRYENGALRLDNTRLFFKLDAEGNPCDYGVYEQAR